MWFALERCAETYCDTSPFHIELEGRIGAPPERVFDVFAGNEDVTEWYPDVVASRFLTPPPHPAGSVREVSLTFVSVKERFLVWDRGRRVTFAVDAMSLPLVRAMVEDMRFEPIAGGSTRVVWTIHYRPSLAMRLVHPVARAVFGRMFRKGLEGLAAYLERS
jgi:uncharacterized protein YndB with AHSA1/START domain